MTSAPIQMTSVPTAKPRRFFRLHGSLVLGAWSLLLALGINPASAASLSVPVSGIDPQSGIDIRVESAFDKLVPCGFMPLRIVVDNNSPQAGAWSFSFSSSPTYNDSSTYRAELGSVRVESRAQRIVEVMVPVMSDIGPYSYPRLTVQAIGRGCGAGSRAVISGGYSGGGGGKGTTAFTLMSDTLGLTAWSHIEAECKTAGIDLDGSQFEVAKAPGDHRGWLGADSVWLSDTDWNGFDALRRQALLDWVKLGGRLHVCFTTGGRNDPLPDLPMGDTVLGLGRIDRETASKDMTKFAAYVGGKIRAERKLISTIRDDYTTATSWPLRSSIPPVVVHTGLIMLFVCLFAVLIGPVNLFMLARRKKHMHLFWTTPALSIVASIGLALVIILQDGFGGRGNRLAAVYLDPTAHKAYVVQEQVSRTGVLLSRSIPARSGENIFLTHVHTDDPAPHARHMGIGYNNRPRNYVASDEGFSGDWFSSRSVDGHLLAAVQTTRARIEISPGPNGPTITSGIDATLDTVYYRDIKQNLWVVEKLKTGERREMKQASDGQFSGWWSGESRASGGYLRERISAQSSKDDYFFASTSQPSENMIPTLPSIRWKENKVFYFGPVAAAGAP